MTVDDPRTDADLVAAFCAGDGGAFDVLVRRHSSRVYALCMRYFGNATDAEDAAQEVFVTLLRRAGSYANTAAFTTWLHRVTMNTCHDLARKRARRPRTVGGEGAEHAVVSVEDPHAAGDLAAVEVDTELRDALATLEPETRAAVVAHDVEGIPYADIAAAQGVAVGTIKSRIHRGHARLAAVLSTSPDRSPRSAASGEPEATRERPT